jgi:hypothetical protein
VREALETPAQDAREKLKVAKRLFEAKKRRSEAPKNHRGERKLRKLFRVACRMYEANTRNCGAHGRRLPPQRRRMLLNAAWCARSGSNTSACAVAWADRMWGIMGRTLPDGSHRGMELRSTFGSGNDLASWAVLLLGLF